MIRPMSTPMPLAPQVTLLLLLLSQLPASTMNTWTTATATVFSQARLQMSRTLK
jgi:hypothetical protein